MLTYGKFLDKYELYMDCVDYYDKNGEELDIDPDDIPRDTKVLHYAHDAGLWSVDLDI